mmetsp:Transcript_18671/g.36337  ORF Transcript_18671/g.36337 Transcript_18671/m.36337 type:complete len:343 (+) Transcript_18671:634-1662(+)
MVVACLFADPPAHLHNLRLEPPELARVLLEVRQHVSEEEVALLVGVGEGRRQQEANRPLGSAHHLCPSRGPLAHRPAQDGAVDLFVPWLRCHRCGGFVEKLLPLLPLRPRLLVSVVPLPLHQLVNQLSILSNLLLQRCHELIQCHMSIPVGVKNGMQSLDLLFGPLPVVDLPHSIFLHVAQQHLFQLLQLYLTVTVSVKQAKLLLQRQGHRVILDSLPVASRQRPASVSPWLPNRRVPALVCWLLCLGALTGDLVLRDGSNDRRCSEEAHKHLLHVVGKRPESRLSRSRQLGAGYQLPPARSTSCYRLRWGGRPRHVPSCHTGIHRHTPCSQVDPGGLLGPG